MRLLLILLLSLTVKAQANGEPYALYGCFHNGQAYAVTMDAQTCPSFPVHAHVKDLYSFHYAITGTLHLRASQSRAFTFVSITPIPTKTDYPGNPDCIISKVPLVE